MAEKNRFWFRCLASLLLAVVLIGSVGYVPRAKAVSQFETGFYKPLDTMPTSTVHPRMIRSL